MGNKTRLNEATVRRFMKLAKLPTVNEQFFNEEEEPMEEPAMEEPAAEEPGAEEAPPEEFFSNPKHERTKLFLNQIL